MVSSKLFLLSAAAQIALVSANPLNALTEWLKDPEHHEGHGPVNVNITQPTAPGTGNAKLATRDENRLTDWLKDPEHQDGNGPVNVNVTVPYTGANSGSVQVRGTGTAILSNRCDYDIWLWSVDQKTNKGPIKVAKRSTHSEPFRQPCDGCGISLKVSKTNQLQGGKQTQFEYAIAKGILYYDISYVDCAQGQSASNCPGHERGHAIDSPTAACGRPNCAAGTYCPTQAYYVDTPTTKLGLKDPVFGCGNAGTSETVYFKMCSDNKPLKRSIAGRMAIDDFA